MITTGTRTCPTCGISFTWTSRSPRHRFCSDHCRKTWWRRDQDNRHPVPDIVRDVPRHTVTGVPDVTDNVTTPGTARVLSTPAQPDSGATQTCPNCHQGVAVITLLVTPAAAHVNKPRDTPTTRRPDT